MKYPCRSTLDDIDESMPVEKYDINAHLQQLRDSKLEADEFVL